MYGVRTEAGDAALAEMAVAAHFGYIRDKSSARGRGYAEEMGTEELDGERY